MSARTEGAAAQVPNGIGVCDDPVRQDPAGVAAEVQQDSVAVAGGHQAQAHEVGLFRRRKRAATSVKIIDHSLDSTGETHIGLDAAELGWAIGLGAERCGAKTCWFAGTICDSKVRHGLFGYRPAFMDDDHEGSLALPLERHRCIQLRLEDLPSGYDHRRRCDLYQRRQPRLRHRVYPPRWLQEVQRQPQDAKTTVLQPRGC